MSELIPKYSQPFEYLHQFTMYRRTIDPNLRHLTTVLTRFGDQIEYPPAGDAGKMEDKRCALNLDSPLYNPPELRRRQVTFHSLYGVIQSTMLVNSHLTSLETRMSSYFSRYPKRVGQWTCVDEGWREKESVCIS